MRVRRVTEPNGERSETEVESEVESRSREEDREENLGEAVKEFGREPIGEEEKNCLGKRHNDSVGRPMGGAIKFWVTGYENMDGGSGDGRMGGEGKIS